MTKHLTPEQARELITKVTREWADKGKIIEGGWQAFLILQLQGAPEEQIIEMRKAYFVGAQHLFASILTFLDGDNEPTENDVSRMGLVHDELQAFARSLAV